MSEPVFPRTQNNLCSITLVSLSVGLKLAARGAVAHGMVMHATTVFLFCCQMRSLPASASGLKRRRERNDGLTLEAREDAMTDVSALEYKEARRRRSPGED